MYNLFDGNSITVANQRNMFPELPKFATEYKVRYPKDCLHIDRLKNEERIQSETMFLERNKLALADEVTKNDMIKRWRILDDRWIAFMRTAKPGDFFEYKPLPYLKTDNKTTTFKL